VITDARGEAVVQLPTYFETLNRDFRYQLTPIGAPAPGLYVSEEVSANRLRIAGGPPNLRISWQVTGIRKDPFADAYRLVPEQPKPAPDRGTYQRPGCSAPEIPDVAVTPTVTCVIPRVVTRT
jgi:hypothetical protein